MAKVNVVHPDGTETPYLGHLEKVVVNYDVKGVCFIEGCVTPPAYMVIQTTSVNGGPRSPGGPRVDAGIDRTISTNNPLTLQGAAITSSPPSVIQWYLYSGPSTNGVTFGNASQTNSTATFSVPGTYTLMLSASNGVHTVAYDAVVVTVTNGGPSLPNGITLSVAPVGGSLDLSWTGGTPPFVVQQSTLPWSGSWSGVATTSLQHVTVPLTNGQAYFRIKN